MKPADYRLRLPEDRDAEYIDKTIRRLNLFTDPTLHQTMYPVDGAVYRQLYDGISRDGGGRVKYLTVRIKSVLLSSRKVLVLVFEYQFTSPCPCPRTSSPCPSSNLKSLITSLHKILCRFGKRIQLKWTNSVNRSHPLNIVCYYTNADSVGRSE